MLAAAQQRESFFRFVETCEEYYGQQVQLNELISTNTLNFDWHFTTHSEMIFTLVNSYYRLSGGRLHLAGTRSSYEIGIDHLASFIELTPTTFEFVEEYSATVFRKTVLVWLPIPFAT